MKLPFRLASLLSLLTLALSACQAGPGQLPTAARLQPAQLQAQSEAGLAHASRGLRSNLINIFDKNGDGRLEQKEIRIPLLLRLLDRNHDGFLTQDELSYPLADKLVTTFLRETSKRMYGLADRDDDNSLNYREFVVTSDMDNKLTKVLFHMVDKNFDDRLDLNEYEDFVAESMAVGGEGFDWLKKLSIFQEVVK